MLIKRGDIFYADLNPVVGSEQGGIRPVLVVQNNVGNKHSPTVIVVPISSVRKKNLPVHMYIPNRLAETAGQNSIAAVDAMRTIIFIMGIFMMLMNYPVRSCASV